MSIATATLLRIPEVQGRLGIKRSKVYELVAAGDLRIVKIGRAALIPSSDVDAFICRLIETQLEVEDAHVDVA